MSNFLTTIIGDKKEWKRMQARADALPRDYRITYRELEHYMFRFTAGDGRAVVAALTDVLDLFESGAAEGRHVLEVTGEDIAAFSDARLHGAPTWAESYAAQGRVSLNRDVATKLGSAQPQP